MPESQTKQTILKLSSLQRSLFTRAWLFAIISLFVVTVVVNVVFTVHMTSNLHDSANAQITAAGSNNKKMVETWFHNRFEQVTGISQSRIYQDLMSQLNFERAAYDNIQLFQKSESWHKIKNVSSNYLSLTKLSHNDIHNIFLIDNSGNILLSLLEQSNLGTNLFNNENKNSLLSNTARDTIERNQIRFSDIEPYAPSNNIISGFFTAPILDDNKQIQGVLAVQMNLVKLFEMLNFSTNPGGGVSQYLIGEDLKFRHYPDGSSEHISSDKVNKDSMPISLNDNQGQWETSEYTNANGQQVFGYITTVYLGNVTWYLVSEIPKKVALAKVNELILFSLFVFAAVMLITVYLWNKKARKVREQIKQLSLEVQSDKTLSEENTTDNETVEKALSDRLNQYISLVENVPGVTYRCLYDSQWTMTFLSQQIEELTGYPSQDLILNKEIAFSDLISAEFVDYVEQEIVRSINKKEPWSIEYVLKTKQGSKLWVYEKGQAIFDKEGQVQCLEGFILDISDRKQTQQEMVKLSRIAAQTDNAVILTDVNGFVEWVNESFTRITGYEPEDILGKRPGAVLQGELSDRQVINRIGKAITNKKPFTETLINYKKDGSPYWINIRCNPIYAEDGAVVGFMALEVDVSEQKETEDKLRLQQQLMESISQQALIGAWELNLIEGSLFWSSMTKIIHEVDDDFEPEVSSAINFYKEGESRDKITELIDLSLKEGIPWAEELQIVTAKGRDIWVLAKGESVFLGDNCIRLFGSFQDINDRKLAEISARNEARQNQILAELTVTETILAGDFTHSKNIITQALSHATQADRASIWLYNINHQEAECLSLFEYSIRSFSQGAKLRYEDFPEYFDAISTSAIIVANDAETHPATRCFKENYLEMFDIKSMLDAVFSVGDGLYGILCIEHIGETREWNEHDQRFIASAAALVSSLFSAEQRTIAEKRLIIAKEEAEAAALAKSEFLATMSHEIRTPMNGVLGMLELLETESLTDDQKRKTHVAKTSANSLLALINEILDFSRLDAGKMELENIDFDVRSLLNDSTIAVALMAQEKGLELVLDLTQINRSMVVGDPAKIRQIVTNLVGNAIKFTSQGEVVVTASICDIDDELQLTIDVRDTGIGIPVDKQRTLFDPFTQVDASTTRRFGGSGLGLAICFKLATIMNGALSVQSIDGQGSTFTVKLRLQKSEKEDEQLPEQNIKDCKILIVDDNQTNREVLEGQLSNRGAKVQLVADSKEALDICLTETPVSPGKPFDIAILDMRMPELNGAELGTLLKENELTKDMPLVIMTSMGIRGDAAYYKSLGFSAYIHKPIIESDLLSALTIVMKQQGSLTNGLVTTHLVHELEQKDTTQYDKPSNLTKNLNEHQGSSNQSLEPENTIKLDNDVDTHAKRILLVEDNKVNQQVASFMLAKLGIEFELAENGLEALEKLKTAKSKFDLVLMDCQMPQMDGFEATASIRTSKAGDTYKDITIVALTANAMAGDREKCIDAGMTDYLSKPIQIDKLKAMLDSYLQ
mgnify:CR=1 FL=1